MKTLVLSASPRRRGNTNSLTDSFCTELTDYDRVNLYDMQIEPCLACRKCQADWEKPACSRSDDLQGRDCAQMEGLFDRILGADLIVLATPVYSWYCTAPMKALLDRCVYALNKYYGVPEKDGTGENRRGPSLWAGKKLALITTCGYEPEKGADLLEEGLKRYCRHSQLEYMGSLVERHMDYGTRFMDKEKEERAKKFARSLMEG